MFKGLTSNILKIIAITAMVVDHIGYYFAFLMINEIYTTLRIIGRISMPIFVFLLVEGYFHTKNLKKYLIRMLSFAILTQLVIYSLWLINCLYVNTYIFNGVFELNILFSFTLSLIILYVLEQTISKIKNLSTDKNIINIIYTAFFLLLIVACIFVYVYISMDYGLLIPVIVCVLYILRKVSNNTNRTEVSNINMYKTLTSVTIAIAGIISGGLSIFMPLSLPFICLYNGMLGRSSNTIKKLFYIIFPLQHFILYALALVCYKLIIM
jgi:hypothetical protein